MASILQRAWIAARSTAGGRLLARGIGTSLSDFDFHVPPELIAQVPAEPRDSARLMVVHRGSGDIEHRTFCELPDILSPSHLLVMNNTRVVNCKLSARGPYGEEMTAYLLRQVDGGSVWEVSGDEAFEGLRLGQSFRVEGTDVVGMIAKEEDTNGSAHAVFSSQSGGAGDVKASLQAAACVPLPPYISAREGEGGYQTVYAKEDGSVAAPTAGLHFTEDVFRGLESRGIRREELTLHVGYGTFGHVHQEDLEKHRMHSEHFHISADVAASINSHRAANKPILSVGTTSTRVLESVSAADGTVHPGSGETNIFLRPGYKFKVVDSLLTNFHMPRLTPIMLVSAFAGYDTTMRAYREAIAKRYRFFSFGDSMLIL